MTEKLKVNEYFVNFDKNFAISSFMLFLARFMLDFKPT